jgi:sugar phosphate permease
LCLFDYFTFSYLPIEKKLFVQAEQRSMEEKAMILHAEDTKQVVEAQKENVRSHQVSYYSVLQIKEVQLFIISGALKNLANLVDFNDVGITKDFTKYDSNFYLYFYGSCFALLLCGIIHDTVFNGKAYLLVVILNLISICVQVITTVEQALGISHDSNS